MPDDTFRNERSQVVENADGLPIEVIEGGARRSQNLFHSFREFNVSEGRSALFTSPDGLENIFSRVTGSNPSEIFGTLGVAGPANLYFLNPNGIIFGEAARLDIDGSFFGSTADNILFSDGTTFSATSPADELLTVSVPLGLQTATAPPGSTLVNRAAIATGQDLTLTADALDLQGQLAAGGALTLQAADRVRIRDTADAPFIATSGQEMVVLGERAVDISALSHPSSGFASGGNLTLRSPTVTGDARYWSGGDLRVEALDGSLGDLISPNDPVLRVAGDVTFRSYSGASLHILAGGSVTVPGAINITGADPDNGLVEVVPLSNGSAIAVNGQSRPTLDIRAGTLAVGTPGAIGDASGLIGGVPDPATAATSADISIGQVTMADNGLVLLTNQFEPNTALPIGAIQFGAVTAPSSIGGASLVVDSRDRITALGNIDVSTFGQGNAGDVVLLAENSVVLNGPNIRSTVGGNAVGDGGNIEIVANALELRNGSHLVVSTVGQGNAGNIRISATESVVLSGNSNLFGLVNDNASGNGGNVEINTAALELTDGSNIFVNANGRGNAGSVIINADESVLLNSSKISSGADTARSDNAGRISITTDRLQLLNNSELIVDSDGSGDVGTIRIDAVDFEARNRSNLRAVNGGTGGSGRIAIRASGAVEFANESNLIVDSVGNGDVGIIEIDAVDFEARNRSNLRAVNGGTGEPGRIAIRASGAVEFANDSDIFSISSERAVRNGSDVGITAGTVEFTNDAEIFASTRGQGDAGDIRIGATELVRLSGESSFFSLVNEGALGDGGTITIRTSALEVLNGSSIFVNTNGNGGAGNVVINASDYVAFASDGAASAEVSGTATGEGGNISITTGTLEFFGDSELFASTAGQGNAGDIVINARNRVTFNGGDEDGPFPIIPSDFVDGDEFNESAVITRVDATATGTAGNIEITAPVIEVLDGAVLTSSTSGNGDAGSIIINASDRVTISGTDLEGAQRSTIESVVSETGNGAGGSVEITTSELEVRNGARLATSSAGRGDAGSILIEGDRVTFAGESVSGEVSTATTQLEETGRGTGGNIEIEASELTVLGGAQLTASSAGQGSGGNILIEASDRITLAGESTGGMVSTVASRLDEAGAGTGGDIQVTAPVLAVSGGATLAADTSGQGDAGSVSITAAESVVFSGTSANGAFRSGAFSSVSQGAEGNGNDINMETTRLGVMDGAQLSASTSGMGNAGGVNITASDRATFSGTSTSGERSTASSEVEEGAVGRGGDIQITAPAVQVLDGAQLAASSSGQGRAGNILIEGERVTFTGGSISGEVSTVTSQLEETGRGRGGNIEIAASELAVLDGAQLTASSAGRGDGGSIIIEASDRVTLAGESTGGEASAVTSQLDEGGTGTGSDISVTAPIVAVSDGATLTADTSAQGDAGSVSITASDRVTFSGTSSDGNRPSSASSRVNRNAVGNGNNVTIRTGILEVIDGAQLTASTFGQGNAGNVIVDASDRIVLESARAGGPSSGIFTTTGRSAEGAGGRIRLSTPRLRLANGAVVNARTRNDGRGGSIRITADTVDIADGGQVVTTTLSSGRAGSITLSADEIRLTGQDVNFSERRDGATGSIVTEGSGRSGLFANTRNASTGLGGDITVRANRLTVNEGAIISAQSEGEAGGGSIRLNIADGIQFIEGEATAAAESSFGGDVLINTGTLSLSSNSILSARSEGQGTAGSIDINVTDTLRLVDSDISTAARQSSGGNITINTLPNTQGSFTRLEGDSDITTNSQGNGGNIIIAGNAIIALDDSDIVSRSDSARGGNITLTRLLSEPTPPGNADDFDGNDQVDLNASGAIASGTITLPDTSFIQNSLADLPEGIINTESLIAGSCVVRNEDGSSTFTITGAGGLRDRPGTTTTNYPTGEVQPLPVEGWQPGDRIVEPQGVYQLPNGEIVLTHACQ
ncbi:MAG: filamentous hemagglutinin N-terminal domain-containing protein [Cyanobacteria bacterium P01_A01_bin.135]